MPTEIRTTVDGAEFYSFVRALKRRYRASGVAEVVISAQTGKLTLETARGGRVLPFSAAAPLRARIQGENFFKLVHLAGGAKDTGPLTMVFQPGLGEFGLPHSGTKAKFDAPG